MSTFNTTRKFAAEPSAVFDAIRDPARLARWWGPAGFSNRFTTFEFQPGGDWVFDMIGPDGKVYPNQSKFKHIQPDHQVVIQHVNAPHFELTITLEPANGGPSTGTLLRWSQAFADASVAKAVRHIVVPANEQNLDRLGVELGLG